MDPKKVQQVVEETVSEAMLTLFSEKPSLTKVGGAQAKSSEDSVIASIGLTGYWNGSVVVVAPLSDACDLVSKMLGAKIEDKHSQDVVDGIGEMLNIFAGLLKSRLKEPLGSSQISLPAVIVGVMDAEIARMRKTQSASLTASLGTTRIEVYFCYSEQDQNEYAPNGIGETASEFGAAAAAEMLKKMYQAREKH